MWDFLWYLFAGAVAGAAVVAVVNYWDQIRETVRSWLHEHGLSRSWLMSAFVVLDRYMGRIRSQLYVQDHYGDEYFVEEGYPSPEELQDPEIQAALQKHGESVYEIEV